MYSSLLLQETQRLWRGRDKAVTLKKITEETGLSKTWLINFDQSNSKEPGVCKVETLYRFLSGQELKF